MEKPASNKHPIHELLRRRWSPRAFNEQPVEKEKLRSIFEAARWAPSAANTQPWRFILAVRGEATDFQKALECLGESNRVWVHRAGAVIFSVAQLARGERKLRHAWHDVGLATENMALQAVDLGLFLHPMAGFDPEKVRAGWHVPEGFEPVTAMAVGYPGDLESLAPEKKAQEMEPRQRNEMESFVFKADWETPAF